MKPASENVNRWKGSTSLLLRKGACTYTQGTRAKKSTGSRGHLGARKPSLQKAACLIPWYAPAGPESAVGERSQKKHQIGLAGGLTPRILEEPPAANSLRGQLSAQESERFES